MDEVQVQVNAELEAEDTLAVRLKKLRVEGPAVAGPVRQRLERQTKEILDGVKYLEGGELSLIEVDGGSNAVQIRSKTPTEGKFAEVTLRGGNEITVEGRGAPLHVSRENYGKLVEFLTGLVT
jgi:hypothetical protein